MSGPKNAQNTARTVPPSVVHAMTSWAAKNQGTLEQNTSIAQLKAAGLVTRTAAIGNDTPKKRGMILNFFKYLIEVARIRKYPGTRLTLYYAGNIVISIQKNQNYKKNVSVIVEIGDGLGEEGETIYRAISQEGKLYEEKVERNKIQDDLVCWSRLLVLLVDCIVHDQLKNDEGCFNSESVKQALSDVVNKVDVSTIAAYCDPGFDPLPVTNHTNNANANAQANPTNAAGAAAAAGRLYNVYKRNAQPTNSLGYRNASNLLTKGELNAHFARVRMETFKSWLNRNKTKLIDRFNNDPKNKRTYIFRLMDESFDTAFEFCKRQQRTFENDNVRYDNEGEIRQIQINVIDDFLNMVLGLAPMYFSSDKNKDREEKTRVIKEFFELPEITLYSMKERVNTMMGRMRLLQANSDTQ